MNLAGMHNTFELLCVTAKLAISLFQHTAALIPLYERDWQLAKEEDRERVSFIVQPQVNYIR